jgi:hypothetical protein
VGDHKDPAAGISKKRKTTQAPFTGHPAFVLRTARPPTQTHRAPWWLPPASSRIPADRTTYYPQPRSTATPNSRFRFIDHCARAYFSPRIRNQSTRHSHLFPVSAPVCALLPAAPAPEDRRPHLDLKRLPPFLPFRVRRLPSLLRALVLMPSGLSRARVEEVLPAHKTQNPKQVRFVASKVKWSAGGGTTVHAAINILNATFAAC